MPASPLVPVLRRRPSPRSRPRIAAGLASLALALGLGHAPTTSAADEVVKLDGTVEADEVGDARLQVDLAFPAAFFAQAKAQFPDARRWLQDLVPSRANLEWSDPSAAYVDAKHAVSLEMTWRGAVKNRGGGRWEMPLEGDTTLVRTTPEGDARPTAWFRETGTWDNGFAYTAEYAYRLPRGATRARFDAASRVLSWHLAPAPAREAPRLALDLRVRERLMSTIYKVYGLGSDATSLFWVAKAVFRNEGGTARNLRVRYRLGSYGDWSPWSKYPEVVRGQTVVDVLYPVLDPSIAKLRSNTPANLLVEWSYEDADGRRHDDDTARRVVILGVNEFVFGNLTAGESFGTWHEAYNNAPLLAAWVTRNDPVVKQFAAMANRLAGGVGASTDAASALQVLGACYELLLRNDFTYQHPPALLDRSVSFDPKMIQNVKLPRETLRDRSGTCIDLAILFAAMANALGLEPSLMLVPGHCFPVVRTPDGKWHGVEVTGVRGGQRTGAVAFDAVHAHGNKQIEQAMTDGRYYRIDLHDLWTKGVANPEIEDLPADILERWGISEAGRGTGSPPPPDRSRPTGAGPAAVLGLWGGDMDPFAIDDELTLNRLVVGVEGPASWRAGVRVEMTLTRGGRRTAIVIRGVYEDGRADATSVRFPAASLTRSDDTSSDERTIEFFPLVLSPGADGTIEGRFDGQGGFPFRLRAKEDEPETPTPAPPPAPTTPPPSAIVGEWGGTMGAADIGDNVKLDEMYVDARRDGAGYSASVTMKVRLGNVNDLPVVIEVTYRGGREDRGVVRFAKVPWNRRVPSTGKRDQIEGNPLTLSVQADGRLAGKFEGPQGMPFTLLRRGPVFPDTVEGAWGGAFGDVALPKHDDLRLRHLTLRLFKTARTWSAAVAGTFLVTTPQGPVEVRLEGTYVNGRHEGDALRFPGVGLSRLVVPTGARDRLDGEPLEVRLGDDGRLDVRFVGDDGFAVWMARADR